MSEHFVFTAQKRTRVGKGASRLARREQFIPASVYGNNQAPQSVLLNPKEILSQLKKSTLFSNIYIINIETKSEEVLVRHVQLNPVTDTPIHIDLLRIGENTTTRIEIPIVFHNQEIAPGIKQSGGNLNIATHFLEVRCNPKKAPKHIEIDLKDAKLGHVTKIEDISLPQGAKAFYPKGFAIASITVAHEETEPTESEPT